MAFKRGDEVRITFADLTVPGRVTEASRNGRALMLQFDAILGGHVGFMPVLQGEDDQWRALVTTPVVILEPLPRECSNPE